MTPSKTTEILFCSFYDIVLLSKIDCGAPIYGLTAPFTFNCLNPVKNTDLHPVLGAFRTTPSLNLPAEASQILQALHRKFLIIAHYHTTVPCPGDVLLEFFTIMLLRFSLKFSFLRPRNLLRTCSLTILGTSPMQH